MALMALQGPFSNPAGDQVQPGFRPSTAQPAVLPAAFPCCSFNRNGRYGDVVAGVGYDGTRVEGPQTSGLMLLKIEATAARSQSASCQGSPGDYRCQRLDPAAQAARTATQLILLPK